MRRDLRPGWYVATPAGDAGPYRWRDDAVTARPPGTTWPIFRVPEPCGCGGLCDPGEPCPVPPPSPVRR